MYFNREIKRTGLQNIQGLTRINTNIHLHMLILKKF